MAYSLCYGTMVAKMCRVYYIFSNLTAKKKILHLHDSHIFKGKDWL